MAILPWATRAAVLALGCSVAACAEVADEPRDDAGSTTDALTDTALVVDTGPPLSASPDRTWAEVRREKESSRVLLFIEVWPRALSSCSPPADVDDILVMGVQRWDGTAGTFPLGVDTVHGRGVLSAGLSAEPPTGTLTVEPFVDGTPKYVSYDTDATGKGRIDISRCGNFDELPR